MDPREIKEQIKTPVPVDTVDKKAAYPLYRLDTDTETAQWRRERPDKSILFVPHPTEPGYGHYVAVLRRGRGRAWEYWEPFGRDYRKAFVESALGLRFMFSNKGLRHQSETDQTCAFWAEDRLTHAASTARAYYQKFTQQSHDIKQASVIARHRSLAETAI